MSIYDSPMSPLEAADSLTDDQLAALLELDQRALRPMLYNVRADRIAARLWSPS